MVATASKTKDKTIRDVRMDEDEHKREQEHMREASPDRWDARSSALKLGVAPSDSVEARRIPYKAYTDMDTDTAPTAIWPDYTVPVRWFEAVVRLRRS